MRVSLCHYCGFEIAAVFPCTVAQAEFSHTVSCCMWTVSYQMLTVDQGQEWFCRDLLDSRGADRIGTWAGQGNPRLMSLHESGGNLNECHMTFVLNVSPRSAWTYDYVLFQCEFT